MNTGGKKHRPVMRFWLVLGGLVILLSVPAFMFNAAVANLGRDLNHITARAHPRSIAGLEMGRAMNCIGLLVAKYLHRADADYLIDLRDDDLEFRLAHQRFAALADSLESKNLAMEALALHDAYMALAGRLIDAKNELDRAYAELGTAVDRFDFVIDEHGHTSTDRPKNSIADPIVNHLTVEMSEVALWSATALGAPTPASLGRIKHEVRVIEEDWEKLRAIAIAPEYRAWLTRLEPAMNRTIAVLWNLVQVSERLARDFSIFDDRRRRFDNMLEDEIGAFTADGVHAAAQAAAASLHRSVRLLLGFSIAALALTIAGGLVLRPRIMQLISASPHEPMPASLGR